MKIIRLLLVIGVVFTVQIAFSQDSLITALAQQHVTVFQKEPTRFTGQGWEKIMDKARQSSSVLIGEDHFFNEVPAFVSALAEQVHFDNFFCEIDPYSAKILQNQLKTLSPTALNQYVQDYGNTFSFFALEPEFKLLQQLTKAHVQIHGLDQITSVADQLVFHQLQMETKNKEAKAIYGQMKEESKKHFEAFLKNPAQPFYMFTEDFDKKINQLSALKLGKKEEAIIEAMKRSAKIYKEQNHALRVQLLKNELMKVYPEWYAKKNLFKFGAVHLAKGESLLRIHDIGNLVNNVADSQFKNAFHLMIVGKSGFQGMPFSSFPAHPIDENSEDLKALKPLFKAVNGDNWHCFDLLPLRQAMEAKKISINDITLSRIIKGYDMLVIVPTVTAAPFLTKGK